MISRIHIAVRGAVQGVGFRPFIYRLAKEINLSGYVLNNSSGVFIEAEGTDVSLRRFLARIENEKPNLSVITSLEYSFLDPVGFKKFEIKESEDEEEVSALILPDIAVCTDCLNEMLNPADRRYMYPFINCTNCGPRFSIVESLPYDRPSTSMKIFKMCDKCRKEYEDPLNRRFHAQPTACPVCGPQLFLWDKSGNTISEKHNALLQTAELIRDGKIIALKGLGGFQLIVDAQNNNAVERLRKRKHREEKPFALMFPDLQFVKEICGVSAAEERALCSPESPIVLLKRRIEKLTAKIKISETVAPKNPYLGAMLPYTPLHHILMRQLNFPVVATSANLSEEPLCIDEFDAIKKLNGIADYFLVHNRPIVRHVDDSIIRMVKNREMVLRRARGYAPLPVQLDDYQNNMNSKTILAVGGHLKNTVALRKGKNIFISQHIGDLSTEEANKTFKKVIDDFKLLYNVKPGVVVSDLHPEYISTKYASSLAEEVFTVQHHYAHIAACRLENQVDGDALGVSWDGTGYGLDKTVWGGEFFLCSDHSFEHVAQFKKFKLPGGEKAIREPRRSLAGLLFEIAGTSFMNEFDDLIENKFTSAEAGLILNMLKKNINSPFTSSAGRIFDGVSSLLNICSKSSFEGQAAMLLEFHAAWEEINSYNFELLDGEKLIIDWRPTIVDLINDIRKEIPAGKASAKFHNTLANIIQAVANHFKMKKVMLSGGCFQNALLTERTIDILQKDGFKVYWHQRIPPNDGGISVGQIASYIMNNYNDKNISDNLFQTSKEII